MSDGQFPPESPQDPVNAPQASPENLSDEPGLAPIGASAPEGWTQNPDEPAIDVPSGGQYPDDVFGVGGDDAEISFPQDAASGGLADVGLSYGDGTDEMVLPPPAEPQPLTEFAMDPIPAPQNDAGVGDMFSIDDLVEPEVEPAVPQAAAPVPLPAPADGGDMFSIDDLSVDEPTEAQTSEPLAAPEPAIEEPVLQIEQPIFESVQETPADAPMAAMPTPVEPASAESAEYANRPVSDHELVFSQPGEEAPPLVGEEIANPYAVASDEADVLDSATGFEEEPEVDADVPTPIVNPYAVVSTEAEVIDPAMALSQAEGVVEETEHEVFVRSDPTIQQVEGQISQDPDTPNDDQPFYQDFNAVASYGDTELPRTDRTESVAPPGMEGMIVGGLVVADGGKGAKRAGPTQKGKKAKRGSFGRGKKVAAQPQAEQLIEPAMAPAPAYAPAAVEPVAAVYNEPPIAQPGERSQQQGTAKPKSFFGIKYGKPEGQPAAPKAVKTGQKSFFGIKYGGTETPPAPAPMAPAPVAQPPVAPQTPIAPVAPVAQPESFTVPAVPYAEEPVHPYAEAPAQPQAQVIESAESAAHAKKPKKQKKHGMKQKAPAKVGQKSFFGIKYGGTPVAQAQAQVLATPEAPAAPATAKVGQKSFFGIKYGGTVVHQTPPVAAQPQPVAMPAPVAAPAPPAYAAQQPVQAVAGASTAFPGGYPAEFASSGGHAPAAATAAVPSQAPEQIMPPVAQTAQQNSLQPPPPGQ